MLTKLDNLTQKITLNTAIVAKLQFAVRFRGVDRLSGHARRRKVVLPQQARPRTRDGIRHSSAYSSDWLITLLCACHRRCGCKFLAAYWLVRTLPKVFHFDEFFSLAVCFGVGVAHWQVPRGRSNLRLLPGLCSDIQFEIAHRIKRLPRRSSSFASPMTL